MKLKYHKTLLSLVVGACVLTSCNDSFMQQDPMNNPDKNGFLFYEDELPYFLNSLYPRMIEGHQNAWSTAYHSPWGYCGAHLMYGDIFTDNSVQQGNGDSRQDQTYIVPAAGGSWTDSKNGWHWDNVREINYFLTNYKNAEKNVGDPRVLDKWAAEAYFFKALEYFRLTKIFGDVTWYVTDMDTESTELYAPRDPRDDVMDSILKCIDFAIDHLADNKSSAGRINPYQAHFLKTRICLYEGTFQKYHKNNSVRSEKYLREAQKSSEAIINSGRYQLFGVGQPDGYWKLFGQTSAEIVGNKEAILARTYDGMNPAYSHSAQRYYELNRPSRPSQGATKDLVDDYLCIDGKPIFVDGSEGSYVSNTHFLGYGEWMEMENRDPRLKQTINKPGEYISIYSGGSGQMNEADNGILYPKLGYNDTAEPVGTTVTGYRYIKHWMGSLADSKAQSSTQAAIEFRYGELLINYAEVMCELGEASQAVIDKTVNKLRERAGFDFGTYPSAKLDVTNIAEDPRLDQINAKYLGYAISPLLREIRRERRVEMAQEDTRWDDIVRWKAGKYMTKPYRGILFTEELQDLYDGSHSSKPRIAYKAVAGVNTFLDKDGFIIGYPLNSRINNGEMPWSDYRYLWPIPSNELKLNDNISQNPGWDR